MKMNTLTEQLIQEIETLPPPLQQEALHFAEFLKSKRSQEEATTVECSDEHNGAKLARIMSEIAARGNAFQEIEDPTVWQREIRKDRLLPGRG
ncbi:DUF2281 domain-containing protein [Desulfurispira natronophila]|uniref:DUF2281 domain-containing protein n=1 Tax=Desulfurispira natronophila TaxID=682562 RepID=A0A7W7Y645_9BACT|nr:DUF2281 domain-containing protein [Desulfurispira natronophila]MBB5022437.1 hypothetical protein [Desulfurispira natronophila]